LASSVYLDQLTRAGEHMTPAARVRRLGVRAQNKVATNQALGGVSSANSRRC
jgi:hypothetical protein